VFIDSTQVMKGKQLDAIDLKLMCHLMSGKNWNKFCMFLTN